MGGRDIMKTIETFLIYLNSLQIKFREENGCLRYNAPKGTVTPSLLKEMAERKAEILRFLRQANLASSGRGRRISQAVHA